MCDCPQERELREALGQLLEHHDDESGCQCDVGGGDASVIEARSLLSGKVTGADHTEQCLGVGDPMRCYCGAPSTSEKKTVPRCYECEPFMRCDPCRRGSAPQEEK